MVGFIQPISQTFSIEHVASHLGGYPPLKASAKVRKLRQVVWGTGVAQGQDAHLPTGDGWLLVAA